MSESVRHDQGIRFLAILIILTAFGFLSIKQNLFLVTDQTYHRQFEINSEQYILDGLLRLQADPSASIQLGRYQRPGDIVENWSISRKLYEDGNRKGVFKPYQPHLGGQLYIAYALHQLGVTTIDGLHAATSMLLALTVAAMCWFLARDFGMWPALLFGFIILSNPIITTLGRNLYWLPFTWFLPMLAVIALRSFWFGSCRRLVLAYVILSLLFFLKIACGYEFITTVFFAACTPLVYRGLQLGQSLLRTGFRVVLLGFCFVGAFSSVLALHSYSLSRADPEAVSQIALAIERRVYSPDLSETARKICSVRSERTDASELATCQREVVARLSQNRLTNAARYLLVGQSLPWIHLVPHGRGISSDEKALIRTAIKDRNPALAARVLVSASSDFWIHSGKKLAQICALWAALFGATYLVRKGDRKLAFAVVVAFLAPMSWFVMAKGHSIEHHFINVVLWFAPFIPYVAMGLLSVRPDKRWKSAKS